MLARLINHEYVFLGKDQIQVKATLQIRKNDDVTVLFNEKLMYVMTTNSSNWKTDAEEGLRIKGQKVIDDFVDLVNDIKVKYPAATSMEDFMASLFTTVQSALVV